ncbi:MAG: amino acid adenylation domain-containing protein [Candidatus Aminicenantes bacterium]|nr:MAG: amino acid adenylation domain-containing protein [Candidatus Aminicenantes bacterium]
MPGKCSQSDNIRPGLDIAVIGMAGKFPGANHIEEYWNNLKNGVESIAFFSDRELLESGVHKEDIRHPNYMKAKGYITGVEYFDASFFGYSPREAEQMDPQTRVLHECVWHALEQAGYDPYAYKGAIGFYVGAQNNFPWQARVYYSGSGGAADTFNALNLVDKDQISTRISYKLNLTGPSFQLVTQCSTSLVAVHEACQALMNRECDMALAGGISITFPPKHGYYYQEGMIYSQDGHLRAFDAKSQGTVFGNGAGVVLLKLIEEAMNDNDHIMAVIKSSFLNNDGNRKVGYTAPSLEGQAEVIKAAMDLAEIEPETIGYIETHGTATALGDYIEIEALKLAFNSDKRQFCPIGTVKTNIGHVENAAGIAALIKTVLALKHRLIPPTLHFHSPNPKIDFESSPFYVNTELAEWKRSGSPLRAGVSNFGIGGTNAHLILEEAPSLEKSAPGRQWKMVVLSAKTETALTKATDNMRNYLQAASGIQLADAAYTLQVGRKRFQYRRAFVGSTLEEAAAALEAPDQIKAFHSTAESKPVVVFMFPGQGAQYVNMGLGLYQAEPLFRQEIDHCFDILKPIMGDDPKEILYPAAGGGHINQTGIAQPLIFAFEYALAKLLMSWGIQPAALIGHSIGEYTAACLAGVFSQDQALKLVAARGQLIQKLSPGAMLTVSASEKDILPLLGGDTALAAVNTPSRCVISGPLSEIDPLQQQLKAQGYQCSRLHTSHAFHSPMMEPILKEFQEEVERVDLKPPVIPYISNISGNWITGDEAVSPAYWTRHLRETVRFANGIKTLGEMEMETAIFIEVGPGNVLSTFVRELFAGDDRQKVIHLVRHPRKETADDYYLLDNLAEFWLYGGEIDWAEFYRRERRHRIPLPLYPFERERYWIDEDPPARNYHLEPGKTRPGKKPGALPQEDEDKKQKKNKGALKPRPNLAVPYAAPRNPLEKTLVNNWKNYFGFEKIGIHDDFFDLGGDSLKALSVIAEMQKALKVEIPISEFFQHSSVETLAGYIDHAVKQVVYPEIKLLEAKEYYPLSSAQRRLYVLHRFQEWNTSYNETFALCIEGSLKKEKFEDIFRQLIKRHESFRTSFAIIAGEPVQRIWRINEIDFEIQYLEPGEEAEAESIIQEFIRPFELSRAPLLRVGLLKTAGEKHILMVDMHHIITDGTSHLILTEDFLTLYKGEALPGLQARYKDFTQWQDELLGSEKIKKQEEYWVNEFADPVPELNLPTDYSRPGLLSFEGKWIKYEMPNQAVTALKQLASGQEATLFMVLLAVFNILLSRLSSQEEIICGSVTAGRRRTEFQRIIGMFVNTLALRNYPRSGMTFVEFLSQIRKKTLQAFENQDYQFETLVEKVVKNRDTGRNPLFDVLLVMQNIENPGLDIDSLKVRHYEYEKNTSNFDLTLWIFEIENQLVLAWEYSTKLFKKETIERFIQYFVNTVSGVLENPGQKIAEIEIIPTEEKQRLLVDFNDTAAAYPGDKTVTWLFENQVEQGPDCTALAARGAGAPGAHPDRENTRHIPIIYITYRELNEKANQLARWLRVRGVQPGIIAGLLVNRHVEMMVGILAIVKAGGAYLPLDPFYPADRINNILEDSQASFILTGKAQKELIKNPFEAINIEIKNNSLYCGDSRNPDIFVQSRDLIYVIYTSGSTGKPKGVSIEHRSLINFIKGMTGMIDFGRQDCILSLTTISFDIFGLEAILPLTRGSRVVIGDREEQLNAGAAGAILAKQGITILQVTPSRLSLLLSNRESLHILRNLKYLLVGGEPFPVQLLERARDARGHGKIYNLYGPTETTIWSTVKDVTRGKALNIGRPIANTLVYILDRNQTLLPPGAAGELWIAGDGLARGYLNRPALTAEKFKTNPFEASKPMYCTGDLAKWLADGNIEFLGRIDHQVKIRGFRIELGEIETQLVNYDGIKNAVVISREDEKREKYLCAYVTSDNELEVSQLRAYLLKVLPSYMVPSYFVQLEEIPLTPNRKVDRNALTALGNKLNTGSEYVAPKSDNEIIIANIWKDILPVDEVGVNDNFFDLGGTSVDMIRVNNRLQEIFAADIPVLTMYKYTTIGTLSQFIDSGEAVERADRSEHRDKLTRSQPDRVKMREKRMRRRNG